MVKILLFIISYVFGTIPSGIIISKLMKKKDPTNNGSKNIGATNMFRLNGPYAGIATFLMDGIKGAIPTIIAKQTIGTKTAMACGIISILGHTFPIWKKSKGGKGVATAIITILLINFKIGILIFTLWISIFMLSGYASMASLISIFGASITSMLFEQDMTMMLIIVTFIIFYKHITNIKNLIYNKENKFNILHNINS